MFSLFFHRFEQEIADVTANLPKPPEIPKATGLKLLLSALMLNITRMFSHKEQALLLLREDVIKKIQAYTVKKDYDFFCSPNPTILLAIHTL